MGHKFITEHHAHTYSYLRAIYLSEYSTKSHVFRGWEETVDPEESIP